jgi:hypothetical protein
MNFFAIHLPLWAWLIITIGQKLKLRLKLATSTFLCTTYNYARTPNLYHK